MKNVILVALILQLVITAVELYGDYTFGDIISFPGRCGQKIFEHFAVYVGPTNQFGQGDRDIFHRIRVAPDGRYCVFDYIKNQGVPTKRNYMDGTWEKLSDDTINRNIIAMIDNCGTYNLRENNCEHLATYVRYGRAYLRQPGSMGGWLFCLFYGGERQCSNADRAVENMQGENLQIILERLQQNARNENDCPTNG
uniref:LRAT domain-containing protein n=1 Tax=Pundamilia nyererei TaxID=303518 RepID=A0A3B4FYI4_9CICH